MEHKFLLPVRFEELFKYHSMNYNITPLLTLFGLLVLFSCNNPTPTPDKYGGMILYTVRDQMANQPVETLKQISDLGYRNIEDAGYKDEAFYGMQPLEYKAVLDSLGLVPISSHQAMISFDNVDQTIADLKSVGFKYLVVPIPPMGQFTYDVETNKMGMTGGSELLARVLDSLGKKCVDAGLKLWYHNHDFEFAPDENGVVPYDYLLEHTNPEYVNFEMDLYWINKAGADPVAYFEKYPGRFKSWHVKDLDAQGRFAPVGQGTLDFAKYLAQKDLAGMEYYFVEQDMTFDGMTPLESLKISHEAIKKLGFQ
ncbi:MAG: sugar phosphate isomerase/epimerase [Flavobacteriaceae bacterium]